MKQLVLAVVIAMATCAVVIAAGGPAEEMLFGMLGPLVAMVVTWPLVEWAHRIDPARVTSVLLTAFVAKALFFGGYVVVVTRVWDLDVIPFMASFTAYFVALYLVQATRIRGLSAPNAS